jgi:hypothetical protein
MDLFWFGEALLLGWLLVRAFPRASAEPLLARLLLDLGLAAILGIGVTSCTFVVFGLFLRSSIAAIAIELALLAGAGYLAFRRRKLASPPSAPAPSSAAALWIAALCLLLAAGLAVSGIVAGYSANPHGEWDAWAIWNLRARFLASGPALAPRAWSSALSATTHTEYPLLLSGFIARCWTFGKSVSPDVPAAVSCTSFLALLALVAGAIAARRGPLLGLLGGLVLAASPSLLHLVPAQLADVPLACYFAGALIFAQLEQPIVAGLLAGCAVWTKDEAWLFLVLFLAAVAIFQRRAALQTIAGVLPVALLAAVFKLGLSHGASLVASSRGGLVHRLFDPGRYATVLAAFGREAWRMRVGWFHPLLPILILAVALRFDRKQRPDVVYTLSLAGAMLAGYFAVYIITPNDLQWQLDTSLNRLFVQVWPMIVLGAFVGLRVPATEKTTAPAPAARTTAASARRKR